MRRGRDKGLNALYYGDNLAVMREWIASDSVDLVYGDPPFNAARNFNVLFKHKSGKAAAAQVSAFEDTWTWTSESETTFIELVTGGAPAAVADALDGLRKVIGTNDMMAYLVMMAPRLVEMHRVLKPTGSLYLHCDPTASHYLKIMLDAVFGPENFRNEITWLRTTTHNDAKRWSPNSDTILYYGKTREVTWNPVHLPHSDGYVDAKYNKREPDGRKYGLWDMTSPNPRPNLTYEWMGFPPPANGWRYSRERMQELHDQDRIYYPEDKTKRPRLKRYLEEQKGPVIGDVWTDIPPLNSQAKERLGYPTQKPVALLERILSASTNEGDIVLDPFGGCGTTVDAAQKMGRRWEIIDITYLAVDLIRNRLITTYGSGIQETFEIIGIPRDAESAKALFERNAFDFERWAVSLVHGQPNEKQVADRGIDGNVKFFTGPNQLGKALVSVKGGTQINPGMVRDLVGTVSRQKAEMGILITNEKPTRGMLEEAASAGEYLHELTGNKYPKIQLLTVADLLAGKSPKMPTATNPYVEAARAELAQMALEV
jgi:DNA modification methylase